jgi:ferredoxin
VLQVEKNMIFYFSATGNSLYAAKRIGGQLVSIAQAMKEGKTVYKGDSIGFVFPCYGFAVPKIVKQFIEQSKFEADYFFAVMTYGNIAANGLAYIESIGEKSNIKFNYTAEILMIDNYLPVYKIEEQLKKEESKHIEENLNLIANDISSKTHKRVKKGLGSKTASALIQLVGPLHKGDVDKMFSVNEKCTKCGICKKVCPKGNISIDEKPVYLHNCDFCMGCINLCPQNAIQLKGQKSKVRFKNQHVTIAEIITANNQANEGE